MIITSTTNVRYITGFVGVFDADASVLVVLGPDTAAVFTDSRYEEAARRAAAGTGWEVIVPTVALHRAACDLLAEKGVASLALESSLTYRLFRTIQECFGGRIQVLDDVVEYVREVKDERELASIASACALGDRAFEHVLGFLRPGITEIDVALEIEVFLRRNGSEGVAFPSIVASGPNSSMPHATVTARVLTPGDVITMDFGARVGGYCSDMTRTVVLGTADDEVRRVYGAVLEAQSAGVTAARGGVPVSLINGAVRGLLEGIGLAEFFGHGLGHGVGLDVHELPGVSPRGKRQVPAGSVITIEPGVYLAGRFGVRIEDCIAVDDTGCRVLTSSPKDLIEV